MQHDVCSCRRVWQRAPASLTVSMDRLLRHVDDLGLQSQHAEAARQLHPPRVPVGFRPVVPDAGRAPPCTCQLEAEVGMGVARPQFASNAERCTAEANSCPVANQAGCRQQERTVCCDVSWESRDAATGRTAGARRMSAGSAAAGTKGVLHEQDRTECHITWLRTLYHDNYARAASESCAGFTTAQHRGTEI